MKTYFLVFLAPLLLLACEKPNVKEQPKKSLNNMATHTNARNIKRIVTLLGATWEVTYSDGCFHSTEYYDQGQLIRRDITCLPGCSFCMARSIVQIGGSPLIVNPSGSNGLDIGTSTEYFPSRGIISRSPDGSQLIFAFDKTKISNNAYSNYLSQDNFNLRNDFALDLDLVRRLQLNDFQHIIRAGDYPLYEDGDVVYWIYDL